MIYSKEKIKNGFSLIEMITVIGIFGIVGAAGFVAFKGVKNRIVLDEAQANLLFALEQAQNRAATGFSSGGHGIEIKENKIVPFEMINGQKYEESGGIPFSSSVSVTPTNVDIIFNRISASTTANTTITISGLKKTITITQDGRIITQ